MTHTRLSELSAVRIPIKHNIVEQMPKAEVFLNQIALFFDFDGTLVDFAPTPDSVEVPQHTRQLIQNLSVATSGALAIITGRKLASLDSLLNMPNLAASGSHGGEWRLASGPSQILAEEYCLPSELILMLTTLAREHQLIIENKCFAMALHFRDKPKLENVLDAELAPILSHYPGFVVQQGKMVREIKHHTIHKGQAIARFMQAGPFAGKIPLFAGDDVTDEFGFDWVNRHGGISIKVGEGTTEAQYRFASIDHLSQWLLQLSKTGEIRL